MPQLLPIAFRYAMMNPCFSAVSFNFVYCGITSLLSINIPWKATTNGAGFARSTVLGTTRRYSRVTFPTLTVSDPKSPCFGSPDPAPQVNPANIRTSRGWYANDMTISLLIFLQALARQPTILRSYPLVPAIQP